MHVAPPLCWTATHVAAGACRVILTRTRYHCCSPSIIVRLARLHGAVECARQQRSVLVASLHTQVSSEFAADSVCAAVLPVRAQRLYARTMNLRVSKKPDRSYGGGIVNCIAGRTDGNCLLASCPLHIVTKPPLHNVRE